MYGNLRKTKAQVGGRIHVGPSRRLRVEFTGNLAEDALKLYRERRGKAPDFLCEPKGDVLRLTGKRWWETLGDFVKVVEAKSPFGVSIQPGEDGGGRMLFTRNLARNVVFKFQDEDSKGWQSHLPFLDMGDQLLIEVVPGQSVYHVREVLPTVERFTNRIKSKISGTRLSRVSGFDPMLVIGAVSAWEIPHLQRLVGRSGVKHVIPTGSGLLSHRIGTGDPFQSVCTWSMPSLTRQDARELITKLAFDFKPNWVYIAGIQGESMMWESGQ